MAVSNALALPGDLVSALPVRLTNDPISLADFDRAYRVLKPEDQKLVTACFIPKPPDADLAFGDFVDNGNKWAPAYVRICQKTPDPPIEGLQVGDLVINGIQVQKMPTAIIPIGFWKTRTLWDRGGGSSKPLCKSFNCLTGTAYGDCDKCTHNSSFNKMVDKNDKCQLQMNMSAVIPGQWDKIFFFSFHGANFMFGAGLHKRVQSKTQPKFLYTHNITTRKEKGPTYTYQVYDFDRAGTVGTPKELYPLLRAYQYKAGEYVSDQITRGQKGEEVEMDKINQESVGAVSLSDVKAGDGEIN